MRINRKIKWNLLGIGVLVVLGIWRLIIFSPPVGILEVCFFDVGQGDAVLINHFNGNQVLIDGGPGWALEEELGQCQPFYDRTIEVVVLTHPHYDHVSGLRWVLENYKVEKVYLSGADHDSKTYNDFKKIIKEKAIATTSLEKGDRLDLKNKASLKVLFPGAGTDFSQISNLNNASLVTRLVYASSTFLFTGDIENKVQKSMLAKDLVLEADIFKVPHQGSRDGAERDFFNRVSPRLSVISVGENSYGHPHQEALEIYKNSQLLRTDEDGTIRILTDGKEWEIITAQKP